ncbi:MULTISPECIES: ribonuclease HI family protein [Haloferax]|uniref:Reverse transcriptase-like protein n=1 Tax=Haloferax marinum TaxID=2666143 RepID=A0A6A8GDR8_9EURY|nr:MULTISPECIES: ribonuclease HI family protein [Haloferax]KAB1190745.1 ribonuclease HI family protein [Haloferax sp. CBA1150]MRW98283.1 reverse transcriptase-like protein [Haloferax marinum]
MISEPLPVEYLSPLATLVDGVLARVGYEMTAATEVIDDAVPGYGGLFDPSTTSTELREALEALLASDLARPPILEPAGDSFVLYVDGSSRGNPGPAGAGAVIMDAEENELARLGRPVGSRTGNNTAEYVALQLGLSELLTRYEARELEVRIDSMTVIRDVWKGNDPTESGVETYSEAIATALSTFPEHRYTHLADSDPNPADALATVGADIAAFGP